MLAELFGWGAVALGACGALLVCVLTLRRIHLSRQDRLRRQAETRLRPLAFALMEGEESDLELRDAREARVLAGLLSRYALQLTGASRAQIASYFERHGDLAREVRSLRDRRSWRRATAAHALGGMSSPTAVPPLVEALADTDPEVRAAAAHALGRLEAVDAVEPLIEALVGGAVPRTVAGWALLSIGAAGLPGLEALATHPRPEIRAVAVDLIGVLGDPAYTTLLTERLRDSAAEIRANAARALGRLGAKRAAADLRAALDDRIPYVRAVAADTLGVIRDRSAIDALLAMATEDRLEAAQAAAAAVGRIDPQRLEESARDPEAGPFLREASDLAAVREL